ncbi:hypothetical protein B0H12DRAFT_1284136 [Mycena haematopus]|nr:hypothetical protein B0H12DRAFT_1284136 [Mycena haematopus]
MSDQSTPLAQAALGTSPPDNLAQLVSLKGGETLEGPENQPLDMSASVKELWEEAAKDFERICGQSLQKGEVKNFDDLQRKIESAGHLKATVDEGKEGKQEKAKRLGLKLLTYLKLLVEVATQGSSLIPIPEVATKTVRNALFFVFDTPKAIKGYIDAIDHVFGDVSFALSQFQIYRSMEKLYNRPLLNQIHLVMASIIKVCAHVVKYRQSSWTERLGKQLKFVFRDDSGLANEMAHFHRVLGRQRDLEGTVTLAVMVETRNDLLVIGKTAADTNQKVGAVKENFDRSGMLNRIRNALSLPETLSLDATTTPMCTELCEKCPDGTGTWIWDHPAYTAWMTSKDTQDPRILFLTGPPSSGKSSAAALITKRLEEQQKSRTYVAHYFFSAGSKKEKNPVQLAMKHLAFQIARVDSTVREALDKASSDSDTLHRLEKLDLPWSELKIGVPGSSATYYLVFGGLDNLTDDQSRKLLDFVHGPKLTSESGGRVRVLVSGTDEVFDSNIPSSQRIQMVDYNGKDMQLVIEKALKDRGLLQSAKPGSIQQRARDNILEKLPQNVKGSYSLLHFGLDEVINVLSMRSSSEALNRVLDQSVSSHEAAVKTLQRSLTEEDIRELNELLKWVIYCHGGGPSLDMLEAAMFLYSGTESLVSLQYIIKNKYSAVLKVEDDCVYGQDGLKEYLEKEKVSSSQVTHSKESAIISMTITIQNVDQEHCGYFLWDLAHKANRDNFSFDLANASRSTFSIAVDEFEAHHTIVKRTFEYLCKDPEEQTAAISLYLVNWLPYHLARLRDLVDNDVGALTSSEQLELGQYLWGLFKDEQVFQRHRKTFEQAWWTADEMDSVKKWLMDPTIVRRLDKAWRDDVQRPVSPTRGFMRELARMVVRGLLRERSWNVANAWRWIKHFMSVVRVFHEGLFQPAETDDASPFSSMDWGRVSAWCQDFLGLPDSELDSLWYERLAEASSLQYSDADTESLYQRAIEKENPSWLCHRGLGRTYFGKGQTAKAIAEVELALKELAREGATPKPEAKDTVELHLLLGKYNYKAGEAQSAVEHFEFVRDSKDAEQARQGQLGYLKATLSLPDAEKTRQLLKGVLAEDGGEARMASVLKMIARDADHNILVSKMFTVAKADPDLLTGIVRVMEAATAHLHDSTETIGDDEAEALGVLLYDCGVAAYRYKVCSNTTEPVGAALRLWKASHKLLDNVGGRNASITRQAAIRALAIVYFRSVVEENNLAHIDTMTQLAKDSGVYDSEVYGFLGALHAYRGEKQKAREALATHVKYALQILSDDILENDVQGLLIIWMALVQYQDFTNAAFALSLGGQPDLLTESLVMLRKTLKEDATVEQQYLDAVDRLAAETIAKTEVPDAAQQMQRITAAKTHIECLIAAADADKAKTDEAKESDEGSDDSDAGESGKKDPETPIHLLHTRICALQDMHNPQIDTSNCLFWGCDGITPDGKKCKNEGDFEHIFYHCVYCWNVDFCGDCLPRLRNPDSGADITACNASHRWIQIPQQGGDMYPGLWAESARVPREVRSAKGDDQILEIVYDEDGEMLTREAWMEALTREWGEEAK